MRRWRHSGTALLLITGYLVFGSMPSDAAELTNDFSVTATAYAYHPGLDLSEPIEGHPTLMIGTQVYVAFHVEADYGPDVPFTFRVTLGAEESQWNDPARIWSATLMQDECRWQLESAWTVECPFSGFIDVIVQLESNAPGNFQVDGTAEVGASVDPDLTNNTATWTAPTACSIQGTADADTLKGTEAVDSICGGAGDDVIVAVGGEDLLFGQEGDDVFSGGRGGASAMGGEGVDTVSYLEAEWPVTVCRENEAYSWNTSSWAPNRLVDIERYVGSRFGDTLEGTSGSDILIGRGGKDLLVGRRGDDRLLGGGGDDRLQTRDGGPDVVYGGTGRDRAKADPDDLIRSAGSSTEGMATVCD